LAARDDGGRKKLSSAGLSGDLQTNQGAFRMLYLIHYEVFDNWFFLITGSSIVYLSFNGFNICREITVK